MKSISLILLIILISVSALAQKRIQPYVKLKSGEVKEFEKIRVMNNTIVAFYANQTKTKFTSKELGSVLTGEKVVYDETMHHQYVYLKLKRDKFLSKTGTKLEGNKGYKVIISNGTNMIILDIVKQKVYTNPSPNTASSSTTTTQFNYYYIKGSNFKYISEIDLTKDEFIDELIADFSSCDGIATSLTEFKEKKGKYFMKLLIFQEIKKLYYKNCLVI